MINKIQKLSTFFILLLPITLITGPAIPDLSITFIGIFFLSYLIISKRYNALNEGWVLSILIFWMCLQIASIFATNQYLSFRDSTVFLRILFIPILMYFWLIDSNTKLKILLGCIFFVNIFIIFDCFYQFINYNPEIGFGEDIFGFTSNFYGRLSGPFGDLVPGSFVSKFSFLGLCYLFILFKDRQKPLVLSSICYLILCGIITFISGERMALATFLLGICLGILIYKNKRLIFIFSLIFSCLLLFLIHKNHPIYNDYKIIKSTPYHLGQTIEKTYKCGENECKKIINVQPELGQILKNFKVSPYGDVYTLALKMFLDNKLFGVGLNNFNFLCNEKNKYNPVDKCWSHPHNFYIQWLSESGILGFTAFIIFLFMILIKIYQNKENEFSKISFITFSILFWPFMSTGSLLKNWHGIQTFFILGIIICLLKYNKKSVVFRDLKK